MAEPHVKRLTLLYHPMKPASEQFPSRKVSIRYRQISKIHSKSRSPFAENIFVATCARAAQHTEITVQQQREQQKLSSLCKGLAMDLVLHMAQADSVSDVGNSSSDTRNAGTDLNS